MFSKTRCTIQLTGAPSLTKAQTRMVLRATERHKHRPVRSLRSHWPSGEPIAAAPTPACLLTAREIKLLYLLRSNQAVAGCPVGGCGARLTLCLLATRACSRAVVPCVYLVPTSSSLCMYARFGAMRGWS